jgi:hypothetical protein
MDSTISENLVENVEKYNKPSCSNDTIFSEFDEHTQLMNDAANILVPLATLFKVVHAYTAVEINNGSIIFMIWSIHPDYPLKPSDFPEKIVDIQIRWYNILYSSLWPIRMLSNNDNHDLRYIEQAADNLCRLPGNIRGKLLLEFLQSPVCRNLMIGTNHITTVRPAMDSGEPIIVVGVMHTEIIPVKLSSSTTILERIEIPKSVSINGVEWKIYTVNYISHYCTIQDFRLSYGIGYHQSFTMGSMGIFLQKNNERFVTTARHGINKPGQVVAPSQCFLKHRLLFEMGRTNTLIPRKSHIDQSLGTIINAEFMSLKNSDSGFDHYRMLNYMVKINGSFDSIIPILSSDQLNAFRVTEQEFKKYLEPKIIGEYQDRDQVPSYDSSTLADMSASRTPVNPNNVNVLTTANIIWENVHHFIDNISTDISVIRLDDLIQTKDDLFDTLNPVITKIFGFSEIFGAIIYSVNSYPGSINESGIETEMRGINSTEIKKGFLGFFAHNRFIPTDKMFDGFGEIAPMFNLFVVRVPDNQPPHAYAGDSGAAEIALINGVRGVAGFLIGANENRRETFICTGEPLITMGYQLI